MPYTDLRKGRHSSIGRAYHVTTVTSDRQPLFIDVQKARAVIRELKRLQDQGLAETLAYTLMPDHLHWLMVLKDTDLARAVKLLKGRSSWSIGGSVWQPNYYDHGIRQDEDLRAMARYIVANPLRAGLVQRIGDYPWWDAVWLDATLSG